MKRKDKIVKRLLELATAACVFGSIIFLAGGITVTVATFGGFGRVLYDLPIGLIVTGGFLIACFCSWELGMVLLDTRDNYWKKHGRTGKS